MPDFVIMGRDPSISRKVADALTRKTEVPFRLDLSENPSNMLFLDADDDLCPECGEVWGPGGRPCEHLRKPEQRYFGWDDDVIIPFTLNDDGERVVTAQSALDMVRSIIWNLDNPDVNRLDLTPGEVVVDIAHLLSNVLYPGVKPPREVATVTLPDYGIDECREDGTDL